MILVERHQISKNHTDYKMCDQLSFISKNLYNSSLYYIRQHYFSNNKSFTKIKINNKERWTFSNTTLYHVMKNSKEFRTSQHPDYNGFKAPVRLVRGVFKQLDTIFGSYLNAVKSYYKNNSNFTGKPKLPYYKPKNGRNVVCIDKEAISHKCPGYGKISGTDISIKLINATKDTIRDVKIVPKINHYEIIVSYECTSIAQITSNPTKFAGIDIGLNNIISLSSNDIGVKPFLINGRAIKSINQYYHNKKGKLQSLLPKGIHWSKRLSTLTTKRNNKIHNEMHKISTYVVKYLVNNGIECLIVGNNKGIKQNIKLGKINNQNFVSVPYYKLRNMLKYKCELNGIQYIETEESYTSKCSFLDMEPLTKQISYKGNRQHRGLFVSSTGVNINADLNGSLNIIRKVAGDNIFGSTNICDLVEGFAVSPKLINL